MMKTSKAYFNRFKKEFIKWQTKLGLTQYNAHFFHEDLSDRDSIAEISIKQSDKSASVYLSTTLSKRTSETDEGPESHARHEVLHLLISRLAWLGEVRYIERDDLDEEAEAIVVRLEKLLK